jgi:hypothetical protein
MVFAADDCGVGIENYPMQDEHETFEVAGAVSNAR